MAPATISTTGGIFSATTTIRKPAPVTDTHKPPMAVTDYITTNYFEAQSFPAMIQRA